MIKYYCERRFVSKYNATIGVDFGVKPVQIEDKSTKNKKTKATTTIKVNFFDLSGNTIFEQVRNEFYNDVSGIFLVIDASSVHSTGSNANNKVDQNRIKNQIKSIVDPWLQELKTIVKPSSASSTKFKFPIVLCINKMDKALTEDSSSSSSQQNLLEDTIKSFATSNNMKYFGTSCKTGLNIDEMFEYLIHDSAERKFGSRLWNYEEKTCA